MAVSNGGMTLYQDMDTDTNWTGEDGISLEEFQQGVASQQWIVSKSGDETATLALSANMTGAKYIIIPIISTISPFYTLISVNLTDGTNTELFILADQLGLALHRAVAGQWKFNSHCIQFGNNGGTLTLASFAGFDVRCDNSNSGNIRSVLNTYIDAVYFGSGRIISGTTTLDKLFKESNDLDISSDTYDGCTLEFSGEIFAQTDVEVTTTLGNSYGETLVFRNMPNTDNTYTLKVTGIADLLNTAIKAETGATVSIDTLGATSFDMLGGSISNALTTKLATGQTVDGTVFTSCGQIDTNGATLSNITINSTTEALLGALYIADATELGLMSNVTFNEYTGKFAIYIPATVTGTITLNGFIGDGSGTDVYWAGTTGTLTINKAGGTNFITSSTAGGIVEIVSSVNIDINVKDEAGVNVLGALVYVDEDLLTAGNIANTTSDVSGNVATSYSGGATSATIRIRKYGYKFAVRSISLSSDSSTNVVLITDPQQT